MALVFGDSFDHYLIADILKKWTSSGGSPTSATDIAPAYALPPHARGFYLRGNDSPWYQKTLPAALATFISGVWFRSPSGYGWGNNYRILAFVDGTSEQVSVRTDSSGHLTFTRNGTVLATSTNVLSLNTYYHIEVKATIHNSAGAYEVRVDGTATGWIPAATSADTQDTGNASITGVRVYGSGNSDYGHWFQDFYILDTTGGECDDFLGPCRFAVLHPVAVGSSAQWTGNYADNWTNVADQQGDSDTTFNQDSTAGHIDLFSMTDVPAGTVHAIQHVIMARQDAGDARTIRPKTRISSTNYNGTSVGVAGTYVFYTETVSVSPATSAAWDDAEINAAEFGYELVS